MEQFVSTAGSERLAELLKSSSLYDYDIYSDIPYVSNAFTTEWINQMESKYDIPSEVNHLFIVYDPLAGKDGLYHILTSMIFVNGTCVVCQSILFNHTRVNPYRNTLSRHTKDIQLFMLIAIREIGIDQASTFAYKEMSLFSIRWFG